jgi:hypothetical protein
MRGLCSNCKSIRDLIFTDEVERSYCADCIGLLPQTQTLALLAFLSATIPFQEGDKVSVKAVGEIYEGTGHVTDVSFSPEQLASPVVPMFHVVFDDKAYPEVPDESWYPEACLAGVE